MGGAKKVFLKGLLNIGWRSDIAASWGSHSFFPPKPNSSKSVLPAAYRTDPHQRNSTTTNTPMMKRTQRSVISLLGFLLLATAASAQLPLTMEYQGIIEFPAEDAKANPTPTVHFLFSIWDAQTEGKKLWEESQPNVALAPTEGGKFMFSVTLGSIVPIPLKEKRQYWLQTIIDGDTVARTEIKAIETAKATDTSVTQKFESQFGYSFLLPNKAKYNKLGSEVLPAGETEKQNYILPGGAGAITIRHIKEWRMVPRDFKMMDGVHYHDPDSVGRNGKIFKRVYILKENTVEIEILLTAKGETEYADKVQAIKDSFVPMPNAVKELDAWRYGRNPKDYEKGRYFDNKGPSR